MIARDHQQPDISVIIVNYNVKDFLFNCLQSLRNALNTLSAEVIVVDNNSIDGSLAYLSPLFPEVRFIGLEENKGFGKANNLGFEAARGNFVLFLNPDTLVSEDTFVVLLNYMREHPEVGLSGCKLLNHDGTFQLACRRGFPTPWVSFTKIFGLQALFPRSRVFGGYNQTFRSVDETYWVDAVSGAFMFIRREALEQSGGFDPDYFMYGEDLDLCYRISRNGWKIAYVHSTSVIHFKGESTKRSSLNEVRVFYEAMEVFVRKHFAQSRIFLRFLRSGISLRSFIAYMLQYRSQWLLMTADFLLANAALMLGIKVRTGSFLGFPAYAYPEIPLVPSLIFVGSMFYIGEYSVFRKSSVQNVFFSLMISFFLLSTLPYFFEQYAISRGVLVLFLIFTFLFTGALRIAKSIFDKVLGQEADKRVALVGVNEISNQLIEELQTAEARNTTVVGLIATDDPAVQPSEGGRPILGSISYLDKVVRDYRIEEVIVTDQSIPRTEIIRLIARSAGTKTHYRFAHSYDEVITSRIIESITGAEPDVSQYNIAQLKYRISKRIVDICGAIFLLTIGLPIVYLVAGDPKVAGRKLLNVLKGNYSLFGLYPVNEADSKLGKIGLTGLAHINNPGQLSVQAIRSLNEYYMKRYSLSLDFEILIKYFFRKNSGIG